VSVCLLAGAERCLAAGGKKGASNWPFAFPTNTPEPRKNSYSRRYRLTRERELEWVKQTGRRLRTEHLDTRAADSLLSYCRAAVIVPKYSRTIVERNRLRRRIRELARTVLIPACTRLDLVIRALPAAYTADFGSLAREIDTISTKLSLITLGE
jgi:ribonuclease P protein component